MEALLKVVIEIFVWGVLLCLFISKGENGVSESLFKEIGLPLRAWGIRGIIICVALARFMAGIPFAITIFVLLYIQIKISSSIVKLVRKGAL